MPREFDFEAAEDTLPKQSKPIDPYAFPRAAFRLADLLDELVALGPEGRAERRGEGKLKITTSIAGSKLGSYEDSRGYVGAVKVRDAYRAAAKELRLAQRARANCLTQNRIPELDERLERAQTAYDEAEKAILTYEG